MEMFLILTKIVKIVLIKLINITNLKFSTLLEYINALKQEME